MGTRFTQVGTFFFFVVVKVEYQKGEKWFQDLKNKISSSGFFFLSNFVF